MHSNKLKVLLQFPEVIKKVFDSMDEISQEATKLLSNLPARSDSSSTSPSAKKVNGHGGDHKHLNGDLNASSETSVELSALPNGSDNLRADGFNNEYEGLQACSHVAFKTSFFKELCRINNHLLTALGVGHAKILQICSLLARYGIYAKLSGAGGGGTTFAFITKGTWRLVDLTTIF